MPGGRGPAPKDPGARRRRNVPERGEWRDLVALDEPVLGEAGEGWCGQARVLWEAWRVDPVSGTWLESDRVAAWLLAECWEGLAPSEQRLRMDGLGLTPKGKRDLRLRVPAEVEQGAVPVVAGGDVVPLRLAGSPAACVKGGRGG